jgi:GNAT superfamily N-acetyltransferase
MKARKLTAQQAVKLLTEFYEQCPEEMQKAFGWSHAPEQIGRNERVYEFRDRVEILVSPSEGEGLTEERERVIGFGIIEMNTRDAADTEAFLSAGVFPAYRRKGYWHKITAWTVQKAKDLGADYASRVVMKENETHYKRSMREAHDEKSGWTYAGDHWYPAPGYGYFVYDFDTKDKTP